MQTQIGQGWQLVGCGDLCLADGTMLSGVGYDLELSTDGSIKGIITAPASDRLPVPAGGSDGLPLLRITGGRLVAFEVRAYERKPGGSAQVVGCLLRTTVETQSPLAA